jgi:hypothetical protein
MIGWAAATNALSDAEAKVEPAVTNAGRAQHEHAEAMECADFADDKTREEFIRHGGPGKGCDMGFATRDRSRELVADAQVKADNAAVSADIVQRNVTAANGVVDRWIFGIGLAVTLGAAALIIAPRSSPQSPPEREVGSAAEPDTLSHAQ